MVNAPVTNAHEAERALVLGYAPADRRAALAALLALDRRLGELVAVAREPMIAQMRLTWWHEALARLDAAPPPAEPLLRDLAGTVLPTGVVGPDLATLVEGWERLLDEPIDDDALETFARGRGAHLFAIAGRVLGGPQRDLSRLGEGWALADLSCRVVDRTIALRAAAMASRCFAMPPSKALPQALRPLGALALLARADLAGIPPGSPRRVGRMLWHRLTGR